MPHAAREIDAIEVWGAVRDRMKRWEPTLHAVAYRDDAAAAWDARASAARWRDGPPLSPLDGVPVTIKENIATAVVPTPNGSAAAPSIAATEDAPIARIREAGAVIVAKTTMPDYGRAVLRRLEPARDDAQSVEPR